MPAQAITMFLSGRIGVRPRRTSSDKVAQIRAPVASISPGKAKEARRSWAAVTPSSVPNGKAIPSTMKSATPNRRTDDTGIRLRSGPRH